MTSVPHFGVAICAEEMCFCAEAYSCHFVLKSVFHFFVTVIVHGLLLAFVSE